MFKRYKSVDKEEAAKAVVEAKRALQRIEARGEEVTEHTDKMRERRLVNHFARDILEIIGGNHE